MWNWPMQTLTSSWIWCPQNNQKRVELPYKLIKKSNQTSYIKQGHQDNCYKTLVQDRVWGKDVHLTFCRQSCTMMPDLSNKTLRVDDKLDVVHQLNEVWNPQEDVQVHETCISLSVKLRTSQSLETLLWVSRVVIAVLVTVLFFLSVIA